MSLRLLLSIVSCIPIIIALDCHCSNCQSKFCSGDYCYVKRTAFDRESTGCLTPREDAWKGESLPLCERNHFNSTLCLCNNANLCNTNEIFSKIVSKGAYVEQNLIECVNKLGWEDPRYPQLSPSSCNSTFCATYEHREYNEFRDLDRPPYSNIDRQCYNYEEYNTFRIDISSVTPQMNSCLHIRWNQIASQVTCICNTTNCNEKVPMYNLTRRGKGICYLKTTNARMSSLNTETSTCWGDYCFWSNNGGELTRGCVDATGAADNFKLRLGESKLDDDYMVICEGNYCNSDNRYPNGNVVGPSALSESKNLAMCR